MRTAPLFAALLGFAALASANDGAITGVGGTVELLDEHPSISLVAEHVGVKINHRSGSVRVECLLVLTNSGEAGTVRIGFPETFGGDTGPRPFKFFKSTVNGEPIECTRVAAPSAAERPERYWWIKQVSFGAGETLVIRDEYASDAGYSIGDKDGRWRSFEYTLATGASWAGPIEVATVTIEFEDCDPTWYPTDISQDPDFSGECEYTWRFRRIEPGSSGPPYIQVAWRMVSDEH